MNKHDKEEAKLALAIVGIICILFAFHTLAHGAEPRHWHSPPNISQWFQSLMQPDNPFVSCCGEADAFEADDFDQTPDGLYVAIITNGKGQIPEGTRIIIPNAKIKWDAGNPTGHGILFVSQSVDDKGRRQIYCYVPPGGV